MANPPLAGRPPFATDEPEEIYSTPLPKPRARQPRPADPNNRTSAYNVYDNYLDDNSNRQSGVGAVGMGFMNMADDDDDDEEEEDAPKLKTKTVSEKTKPASPLAGVPITAAAISSPNQAPAIIAPRPGYAVPVAALGNLAHPPAAVATPEMAQLRNNVPMPIHMHQPVPGSPFAPSSPGTPMSVPATPHPLQPPMTPITPVFARPSPSKVQFEGEVRQPIMRSNSEDGLLRKRGEQGDDFWRRFSMVVKQEQKKPYKSSWLQKTQSGTSRLSRWVWVMGIVLLLAIGGAIGLGWWLSHNSPSNTRPSTLGGSADETAALLSATSTATMITTTSSPFVTPTNTVQRRMADPTARPKRKSAHRKRHDTV